MDSEDLPASNTRNQSCIYELPHPAFYMDTGKLTQISVLSWHAPYPLIHLFKPESLSLLMMKDFKKL